MARTSLPRCNYCVGHCGYDWAFAWDNIHFWGCWCWCWCWLVLVLVLVVLVLVVLVLVPVRLRVRWVNSPLPPLGRVSRWGGYSR
jgi:hypothetical protein